MKSFKMENYSKKTRVSEVITRIMIYEITREITRVFKTRVPTTLMHMLCK